MHILKALKANGPALLAGPLSLIFSVSVLAQSYVDVEAERAAAAVAGSQLSTPATDPYKAAPAAAYPATSYGVNNAPAPAATVVASSPGQPSGSGGQDLSNLFYQIQQLQQEVMMLNGKVEEQAHELRNLKEQSLERYVDLDRRLAGGTGSAPTTTSSTASSSKNTAAKPITGGGSNVPEQAGEGEAYRSAYALVRSQQFSAATTAFKQFLQDYPAGKYAPNGHYWLGELYLVMQPVDLESSRQAFTLLLSQYPNNSKAPDAMYKLGKVYFLKGNREKAREYLDRVISQYGSTNSSAVKLSRDFIAENY